MEKEQKIYEIGYLLSPLIPEDKLNDEVAVIRKAIEEGRGLISGEERPKMRKLAYSIKATGSPTHGFTSSYFGWIKFIFNSEALPGLKVNIDKNKNIVRFLLLDISKESTLITNKKNSVKRKKILTSVTGEDKKPINAEEIDKKLEEIIG